MSEPIVYIDSSEIREGKLEELKTSMNELVEFVEANEPRLIAYNVYFKEDGTRMTVVHVHHDSASLEFHMKVAGPLFPKFAEFVKLLTIDVYGKPSDDLVEADTTKGPDVGEWDCAGARTLRRVRSTIFYLIPTMETDYVEPFLHILKGCITKSKNSG